MGGADRVGFVIWLMGIVGGAAGAGVVTVDFVGAGTTGAAFTGMGVESGVSAGAA